MILSRLAKSLQSQNWAAVSIELFIVVAGVFIGIQVSNWNENRLTAERAGVLTERLEADLEREAWNTALVYRYHADVLANAERTLQALTGEIVVADRDLLIHAFRATQFFLTSSDRANYDELVATGGVALIADEELRELATSFFNSPQLDYVRESGRESRYRALLRETMPTRAHRELRRACGDAGRESIPIGDYANLKALMDFECAPDLSAAEVEAAASALRTNASLIPALRLRIATMDTEIADIKDTLIDSAWQRFHGTGIRQIDDALSEVR